LAEREFDLTDEEKEKVQRIKNNYGADPDETLALERIKQNRINEQFRRMISELRSLFQEANPAAGREMEMLETLRRIEEKL